MDKFCVFCGERPASKTHEHVVPYWLIKYTGDPNRKVNFGPNISTGQVMQFAFDQLKFPACSECNQRFSKLESDTQKIISSLVQGGSLDSGSFCTLFTWFDKVRVGLWLGYMLLNKNLYGINPHYHIQKRIDIADRVLLIYKVQDTDRGLQFIGVNFPFFAFVPICFGLVINQFYFINISTDLLLSRKLGLPYSRRTIANSKGQIGVDLIEGKKRILLPLIKRNFTKNCTEIYQPIIRPEIFGSKVGWVYKNDYTKKFFVDDTPNIGRTLIIKNNKCSFYNEVPQDAWIPEKAQPRQKFKDAFVKEILDLHSRLINSLPAIEDTDNEFKKSAKQQIKFCKQVNNLLFKRVDEEL